MADVLSKRERSRTMAAVRSQGNKATELKLLNILRRHRITGWRRQWPIVGKPDFAFSKQRLAVFVDGCFWHGCPIHGECPSDNRRYWQGKLAKNKERDRKVNRLLRRRNWTVLRLWEHALKNPKRVAARIRGVLLRLAL
jgi:DNA mismatch endonuclease, patch repair protein